MLQKIKSYLTHQYPALGALKRSAKAYLDFYSSKNSYSQHEEDIIVKDILKGFDLTNGKYIDVGANHPTDISNTFLFYKMGHRGITIEPVPELVKLHQKIRPKDIILAIGISDEADMMDFNITKFPVISSFDKNHITNQMKQEENVIWKKIYTPILPLDTALKNISTEWYYFLSIDVEGLDYQVLLGATKTLEKTYCLLIEFGTEEDVVKIKSLLTNFTLVKEIGCNLLFINKSPEFDKYKIH